MTSSFPRPGRAAANHLGRAHSERERNVFTTNSPTCAPTDPALLDAEQPTQREVTR